MGPLLVWVIIECARWANCVALVDLIEFCQGAIIATWSLRVQIQSNLYFLNLNEMAVVD